MHYFKKSFFLFILFSFINFSYSQVSENTEGAVLFEVADTFSDDLYYAGADNSNSDGIEDFDDDIDSLFENAEDVSEAVVKEEQRAGTDYNVQLGSLKLPIEVSGFLNTELGGAYVRESQKNDATFYFDFKNYIYFSTRPDKYIALKGVLKTSMPKDTGDIESNNLLYLYEMYFDYLMFNRIYITAGKKQSVWGNIRLFSDSDSYNDREALYTNILNDSRDYISGIIKIPFWNNTFTAVGMYNEDTSNNSPGTKDMSFAGSLDLVIFNTSVNIFARRFPLNYGQDSGHTQNPIAGIELKRTLFGFDVYAQSMARIQNGMALKKLFTSGFENKEAIDQTISTFGIFRLWNINVPYIGFNLEYQNIYRTQPSDKEKYFTNRFAFETGMAKLGKNKDLKLVLQWNHNLDKKEGMVQTGIIFSGILAHCDWRNGVKYEYDKDNSSFNEYKLTIGSYLSISLGY